jgi:hypothetical protein
VASLAGPDPLINIPEPMNRANAVFFGQVFAFSEKSVRYFPFNGL